MRVSSKNCLLVLLFLNEIFGGISEPYISESDADVNNFQCKDPIGVQNGRLLDSQITASSYDNYNTSPHRGRLNGLSSWTSHYTNDKQYLEFYFKGTRIVSGIQTQGLEGSKQRVTSFKVSYRTENSSWITMPQTFPANVDDRTVRTSFFQNPIAVTRLRILPVTYNERISMRAEILGCYQPYKAPYDNPMGLQSGQLLDEQISASSYYDINGSHLKVRPTSATSWVSKTADQNQYVEFYFKGTRTISGVSTQGDGVAQQYVTSFVVAYRNANTRWINVTDENGATKVFTGNYDQDTVITNYFNQQITCSRLRVIPVTWNAWISMRIEIIGGYSPYSLECDKPLGIQYIDENKDLAITASSWWPNNELGNGWDPNDARLHGPASWGSASGNAAQNDNLDFNFKSLRWMTGISTQGRNYSYPTMVNSYRLSYMTQDGGNWASVLDENGKPKIFPGNFDYNTVVTHFFDQAFSATKLRIVPVTSTGWVSMRVEIVGCGCNDGCHSDTMNPMATIGKFRQQVHSYSGIMCEVRSPIHDLKICKG